MLIQNGRVNVRALAKELLTRSELLAVVHRQGFRKVDEVEECILEPGGTFAVREKEPTLSQRRHDELLAHLERLSTEIRALAEKCPTSREQHRKG